MLIERFNLTKMERVQELIIGREMMIRMWVVVFGKV